MEQKQSITTLLFSSRGRVNRINFLLYHIVLILSLVFLAIFIELSSIQPTNLLVIVQLTNFLVIGLILMLNIKRWHDLDKSGWMTLLIFIPYVNIVVFFYLLFAKGTDGSNRFDEYYKKQIKKI